MPNSEIKIAAMTARVPLWRIAEELGIADSSFSRKLRKEFSAEEKQKVFDIIERLSKEGN